MVALFAAPVVDQQVPYEFRLIDWRSYAGAAARFLDGQSLYLASQLSGPYRMFDVAGAGYVYPPPSVLLFLPFLVLGPTGWGVANAALFAIGLGAIVRRDFGQAAPLVFGVALAIVSLTRPYLDGMATGNINVGLAGVFACCWALGRDRSQWLAGVGAVIKIHPLALAGFSHSFRTLVY